MIIKLIMKLEIKYIKILKNILNMNMVYKSNGVIILIYLI